MKSINRSLTALVLAVALCGSALTVQAQTSGNGAYLPILSKPVEVTPTPTLTPSATSPSPTASPTPSATPPPVTPATGSRINAPYFNLPGNNGLPTEMFEQMAIAWYGRVTPSDNYTDIRVGYNNTELVVYAAVVDRLLWYDTTPSANDLTNWDATTLYLHRDSAGGAAPTGESFRFDVQFGGGDTATHQAGYRGDGSNWTPSNVAFRTFTTYRGEVGPNTGQDIRGWASIYYIPFASFSGSRPADGTIWRIGFATHDRDTPTETPRRSAWPESLNVTAPASWSELRFGLPVYTPPASSPGGTVTVRNGLNNAVVPDASAGGYTWCGGDPATFFTQWGQRIWSFYNPDVSDFNIQNQSDVADWPCFSKYYISFPLNQIPAGKVIRSAQLKLFQFGGAEPENAKRSWIQVLSADRDFDKATMTWNNAPLPIENLSQAWVDVILNAGGFTRARTWDMTYAVAQAYAKGGPMRLAMYSADSHYHSGKYFVSGVSFYQDERPTLVVEWGNP
jgi:hypothetical protein